MDSFMFRVSIAAGEFPMEEPQGQNRFFDRCAQYLLELSDELERNLYIEAIVKEYRRYGISVENLRKRAEREVQNAHKFALERFFSELLPVRDSLELGLAAASENVDVTQLRAGVELTLRQLAAAMEKFGARDVNPAAGVRFNPAEHEAMAMVPTDQAEPNTVVQVVQKGYSLNERLIRPAKVLVAQAAPRMPISGKPQWPKIISQSSGTLSRLPAM